MPIVASGAISLAPILIALGAAIALVRRRVSVLRGLAVLLGAVAFASLMPLGCGQLQSYEPYTSCQSFSGFSFGFWAGRDTLWWHAPLLTVEVVMLGVALAAAASVAAVVTLAARAKLRTTT